MIAGAVAQCANSLDPILALPATIAKELYRELSILEGDKLIKALEADLEGRERRAREAEASYTEGLAEALLEAAR